VTTIRHYTASAVVLDDSDRVLLVHHNKVGQWLYPGGHTDPNEGPAQAALLIEINLARMCAIATTRGPGTWRLTEAGPQPYDMPGNRSKPDRQHPAARPPAPRDTEHHSPDSRDTQ
jgi:hypothetical protein